MLRVGTRASTLARTQTSIVADDLVGPDGFELVLITTEGDRSQGSLRGLSQTGVFVNALREALLNDECDIIVHSLKDLPVDPHPGISVAAIPMREAPYDVLCSGGLSLRELPQGALVGTSSPRRAAQLKALRPDLATADIRGNIDTRLSKVGGDYAAIVLAQAGLNRIERGDVADHVFAPTEMVPAPGQGALAIEIREDAPDSLRELVSSLEDPATRACVVAERSALKVLEAGCAAPVGAYATETGGVLTLNVRVLSLDGSLVLNEVARGGVDEAERIGRAAGRALLGRGAGYLVREAR